MKQFTYTIIITPEKEKEETSYAVSVPAFPEICTFGHSLEEARFMAQDALELTLLSRLEEGEMIPPNKTLSKIPHGARKEDVVVSVSHQVVATTSHHAKTAFYQSA